jgi:hypothetical protein
VCSESNTSMSLAFPHERVSFIVENRKEAVPGRVWRAGAKPRPNKLLNVAGSGGGAPTSPTAAPRAIARQPSARASQGAPRLFQIEKAFRISISHRSGDLWRQIGK